MNTWKAVRTCLITAAAASLLLSACASAASSATGNQKSALPETYSETDAGEGDTFGTAMADSAAEQTGNASEAQGIPNGGDPAALQQRKLIKTVNLSLETKRFDSLVSEIQTRTKEKNGYVEHYWMSGNSIRNPEESYDIDSHSRSASLTVRIPSVQLDAFLNEISASANVTSRSESVEDVTLQYSDIESHKKALNLERDRLWELIQQADSMDAVIALQTRIGEIEYQLNSYESQLRLYDNQVSYSTVSIDITEVGNYSPAREDSVAARIRLGFSSNLSRMGALLQDLFVGIIIRIPFLIPIFVLVLLLILLVKLVSRKQSALQPPSNPNKDTPDHGQKPPKIG